MPVSGSGMPRLHSVRAQQKGKRSMCPFRECCARFPLSPRDFNIERFAQKSTHVRCQLEADDTGGEAATNRAGPLSYLPVFPLVGDEFDPGALQNVRHNEGRKLDQELRGGETNVVHVPRLTPGRLLRSAVDVVSRLSSRSRTLRDLPVGRRPVGRSNSMKSAGGPVRGRATRRHRPVGRRPVRRSNPLKSAEARYGTTM
jgi:hypothetical protein